MHTSKMVTSDSNGSFLGVLFFFVVGFVALSKYWRVPKAESGP